MPLTVQSNNFLCGLHIQSAEGTPGTVADYSFPLLTGDRPKPVQTTGSLAMTDAASMAPDIYKNAGEHWEADLQFAAFDNLLGTVLASMWPTDTPSGAAPSRLHTFTGLGTTTKFVSAYGNFSNNSISETFAAGYCAGIEFVFSTERPLRIIYHIVGETPSVATFTVTTPVLQSDGYFAPLAPANGLLKFDEDTSTPVAHTNITGGNIKVMRPVTPVMTADGKTVSYLAPGVITASAHLDMVWTDWDAYKSTFYGAAAGTAASVTLPAGSVDLQFGHSVSATSIFQLKIDKVAFLTDPPVPDPAASPLMVSADLAVLKPSSGDYVKPLLTNNVTAAYG